MRQFLRELKDRKVIRVALVYIAAAWVLLQVGDVLFDMLEVPGWAGKLLVALLALGLPLALILAWSFELTPEGVRREQQPESEGRAGSSLNQAQATVADNKKSIAVLPLVNLSGDPDNEYFSDGLTEELLDIFTRNTELRVASRTSCFSCKGKNIDIAEVGSKLKVSHVLEGSVRKAQNRLRITAQLVDVATDSRIWSETYDREIDDIFAIQSDIARQILLALQVSLEAKELEDATTSNARAYDFYLKGRNFLQLHDPHGAVGLFADAVRLDPEFVRAWVSLAQCQAYLVIYHNGGEAARAAAEQAAARALALAPERGDAHAAKGLALQAAGKAPEAIEEFERAIELNPHSFVAYYNYARACIHDGKLEKAAALFDKAAEADTSNFEALLISLGIYRELGDKKAMMRVASEGAKRAERHLQAYPNQQRAYYMGAMAWWLLGEKDKAIDWAERAEEIDPDGPTTRYNLACFYAQIGHLDRAMDNLESLPPGGQSSRSWTENDPDLAALRDSPRFKRYLETLPA